MKNDSNSFAEAGKKAYDWKAPIELVIPGPIFDKQAMEADSDVVKSN